MADLDRVAVRVAEGLRKTLARVRTLAVGMAGIAAIVGVLTFLTGLWVFDGSRATWVVIGGAVCIAPTVAALMAWFYVHTTLKLASSLVGNVRTMLDSSRSSSNVLLDYDTGERLAITAKTLSPLQVDLKERRKELPALYAGVRAIVSVPGLTAIALLGTVLVAGLGAILLLAGLIG